MNFYDCEPCNNVRWLLVPLSFLCTYVYIICIFVCLCQRMTWKINKTLVKVAKVAQADVQ